ncbi:MAG: phospholipase D-like domain-containing protein, partial [Bdellovibrionota bacterium]
MHGYNFFYIIILSIFVTYQALGAVKYSTFDNRTSYHCSPMPEVECKGLMNSHSEGQNQVFTLKRGVDAFTYRVKLIREAKRSIRMQYLIYKNDEAGRFIANLLKQKHDEGVQVTLLVDMLASFGFGVWDFFRDLMRYGIEIASYEEPVTFIINEIFGTNPGSLLHRYHEKIMVVDGEDAEKGVAIMGGLNIANEYFRISKEAIHLWTDMDIGFKGTAVKDAMEMFDRDVNYFRRLTRTGHSQPSGEDIFDDASLITRANKRPASSIEHGTLIDETPKTDLEKMTVEYANLPLSALNLAVYTDAKIRLFQGRPRLKENYIEEVYVNMINESEREIIIV